MNKLGYGILAAMIIIFGLIAIGSSGQATERVCSAQVTFTDAHGNVKSVGGCENDAREEAQREAH